MMRGMVVDETKNTFAIAHGGREVTVPKPANEFQFTYQGEKIRSSWVGDPAPTRGSDQED